MQRLVDGFSEFSAICVIVSELSCMIGEKILVFVSFSAQQLFFEQVSNLSISKLRTHLAHCSRLRKEMNSVPRLLAKREKSYTTRDKSRCERLRAFPV